MRSFAEQVANTKFKRILLACKVSLWHQVRIPGQDCVKAIRYQDTWHQECHYCNRRIFR
jgi:hypothetical protein